MAARTAADGKWVRRTARTAADGVGATEWLPLVMSDLGCADGCGRQMGAENCADGCGRRGCNGVAGNGWGEEAAGDERPWLRGRLRTANGCGELRGWLRTAWVQRSGWKWVGRRSRWVMSDLGCADGCGTANGCGELRGQLRTAWVQGGGWKWVGRKPLVMSDLGCADGCGRQMGAENCVDGCGRRGCKGVAGNGWGEEAAGDERPWLRGRLRDGKWVRRTAWTAADGVGARGWLEMVGEKKPLVMSDPWLRGRLRTANGCGELRGRLRTAWVQGGGWKWVGRRSRW